MIPYNELPGETKGQKEYFDKLQRQKIIQQNAKNVSKNVHQKVTEKIKKEIQEGNLKIGQKVNLDELLSQSQIQMKQREQQIQQEKLEEKKKLKEKLEKEMYLLNNSIDQIKDTQRKNNHSDKKRKEYENNLEEIKKIEQKHKQLQQERLELEKQRKLRIQREEEQLKKQMEEEKRKQEYEKQQKALFKKNQLQQHYEKMQIQQKERELERKKQQQQINQLLHKKPLYQQKQEQYQKLQEQTLLEKKQQLQNIRNLHKPLDVKDLREHDKKYMEQKLEKQQKQQQERKQSYSHHHYKPSYKSENYHKFQEEIRMLKEQQDTLKLQPLIIKQNKIQEYAKKIRKPILDPKLVEQRENNIKQIQLKGVQKDRYGQPKQRAYSTKQIGNNYLKEVTEQTRKIRTNRDITVQDDKSSRISDPRSIQSVEKKKSGVDYVAEFRRKRIERAQNNGIENENDLKLKEILQSGKMQDQEKQKYILYEANKMQEQARRKEELLKIQGTQEIGGKDDQQVDELYIKAIKAKIALLGVDQKDQSKIIESN